MFLSRLDRILKNNFPSTFQRDIGLKSLMLFGFGLPDLGDILFVCIWFEHILYFPNAFALFVLCPHPCLHP